MPNLNASLLSSSLLSLAVCCMTIMYLNLLQTATLFSPSSPSTDTDMSQCHWSHLFTKIPFLLSHFLPFVFLLILLLPSLLNNPVSKPFLCSHIALSHDSPQPMSPEKLWQVPHPLSTLTHPWMQMLVFWWQAHPIGVGFLTLVSSCCLRPCLNFLSHLKGCSPDHAHQNSVVQFPLLSRPSVSQHYELLLDTTPHLAFMHLSVHQHLHSTFCPFPLLIGLLMLSGCCDSFPPFSHCKFYTGTGSTGTTVPPRAGWQLPLWVCSLLFSIHPFHAALSTVGFWPMSEAS